MPDCSTAGFVQLAIALMQMASVHYGRAALAGVSIHSDHSDKHEDVLEG